MTRRFLIYLAIAISFASCNSCKNSCTDSNFNQDFSIPDSLVSDQPLPIAKPVIDNMVQNISSPVETAALIKSLKVPFNKDFMASTKYAERFNTNFAKALALGIYGCDLGYLNMYEKTSLVVDYISTIKTLADGIQVGQFFDFSTLKRLATSNENLDSLVYISQMSFSKIDTYLRETNRSILSVVIVAGVWIEGLYISSMVAEEINHKRINETIGEQKVILNDLILLLSNYKKDPSMANLLLELEEIKKLYSDVRITYEIGESEMIEVNGTLTIIQNDKQTIDMSDETLRTIISKVKQLRNRLLKG